MDKAKLGRGMGRGVAGLGMATALLGLALFARAGWYARFWADDYCYTATIKQLGLFSGLVDWYQHSGNRLSTLVVVALSDLAGWNVVRFLPGLVLAMWAGAWLFFLMRLHKVLRKALRLDIAWPWLGLVALSQVYYAALLAPDRLQTLYWRMGTLHYSLPMPLLLVNLGLLLGCCRLPCKQVAWLALASGLLSFFTAGLSETAAALEAGVFLTAGLAAGVFLRGAQRRHLLRLLAAPLAGALLMMLVMLSAPANAWRQAVLPPPHNLLLIAPYSLRYAADFIFYALRGQVTPYLALALGMGALGVLAGQSIFLRVSPRALLAGAVGALALTYAWVVCSFAPSAFAGLAYPAGRALMPGSVILLAGISCAAVLAGASLRRWLPGQASAWLAVAALALLALASLYPLRGLTTARKDMATLSVKAARWDARHAQIVSAVRAGQVDIRVQQVDVVQSLEDLRADPGNWVNLCAAIDYGARTIVATP